ncbi:MAG: NAD-binding protein [Methylococcales bacterium]|nr:NAD-binding protein [Methylococcales bacterium]
MMKIAIFGNSSFVLEALSRLDTQQFQVIYADTDNERLAKAHDLGLATQTLDFRSDEDLIALGIGRDIEMLFCFFKQDYDNVFLTISARTIDPILRIIALVDDPQSAHKLIAAGADKIIDPYQICAHRMHELIRKPHLIEMLDHTVFGRQDLSLEEILITQDSSLQQTQLSELKVQQTHNLIILGVIDQEQGPDMKFVLGDEDHKLDAGDILVVLGPTQAIQRFTDETQHEKTD